MKTKINQKSKSDDYSPIRLKIQAVNHVKIVLRCSYAWAMCLDAYREEKSSFFYLPNDSFNQKKIKKLLPDTCFFVTKEEPVVSSFPLRSYQKEDVRLLSRMSFGAIFSEMRTGKTPVALHTWKKWRTPNLIVVVPGILQHHWQKSLFEYLGQVSYVISALEKKEREWFYQKILKERGWVVIVSKDIFKADNKEFKKLKSRKNFGLSRCCAIIDEAHFLRNFKSQQSKSVYLLQDCARKLVLTGTPIVNSYTDIYGVLKFLQPEAYQSYDRFIENYFSFSELKVERGKRTFLIKVVRGFKTNEAFKEFNRRIGSISIRRKQKDVLPWLPQVIFQREVLLMDNKQQKIYQGIKEEWLKEKEKRDVGYSLEILTKLRTATLNPKALGGDSYGAKIDYLLSYLQEWNKQSVVVFSTRNSTFLKPLSLLLKEKKIDSELITGDTTHFDRQKIIEKFQSKQSNVLLCNLLIGGLGLDLSQADTAIFADRGYAPADNEQAEARFLPTTPEGSSETKTKMIVYLLCKGTVDEKIDKLLKKKENVANIINSFPEILFD